MAIFVVFGSSPCAAQVSLASAQDRGRVIFQQSCATCHAPNAPGTAALAQRYKGRKPASLDARRDLTGGAIAHKVRQGVSFMPAFSAQMISDQQLADLTAYLTKRR